MSFKNRAEAGRYLAEQLAGYADCSNVLVLALPRGGVPVAFEIAKALNLPLDVFIVRKLGVPGHKELAMGAIAPGGVRVLNRDVVRANHLFEAAIHQVMVREQRELERREQLYRGDRPFPDVHQQTVILVDDGLATGATMRAAILALQQYQPAKVVVAVPIASPETCQDIAAQVDEIICAITPQPLHSVGVWYSDFSQTTDEEVQDLLQRAAEWGQQPALGSQIAETT